MSSWIFPCNIALYDPIGAFAELQHVDWRQSVRLEVGDEVYIYCSKPYQKIMFRTVVTKTEIPVAEVDKRDLRFNRNPKEEVDDPRFGYATLLLKNCRDMKELSLKELIKHGLVKAPQGPMRVTDELYDYLTEFLT